MRESYHYNLWDAAHLIVQGCSDDWFEYFRAWLISMGREVYEQALQNPDSLAEPSRRPDIESVFFEEMLYVAMTASPSSTSVRQPA